MSAHVPFPRWKGNWKTTRVCLVCKEEFTLANFNGNCYRCKPCDKAYMASYRAQSRLDALHAYGGPHPVCACPGCGEDRLPFLSLDHINGGGNMERKALTLKQSNGKHNHSSPGGGALFRWLKKMNYPPGYQVLCHNCNTAKGNNPHCPVHTPARVTISALESLTPSSHTSTANTHDPQTPPPTPPHSPPDQTTPDHSTETPPQNSDSN